MAMYWMRGLFTYGDPAAVTYYYVKHLALFLLKVVGYTYQSQYTTGGTDFTSTEKQSTGAVGSVTGSSWVLTDSSAPFESTDGGKLIVIKDTQHPENCGVYPILQFLTSSTIVVDWLGENTEYPTSSSTISWWILSTSYEAPTTVNDYIRLQSPHSSGWAIELKCGNTYYDGGARINIAVDGDWSGPRIIGTASVTLNYASPKTYSYGYAAASDDGKCLIAFRQWMAPQTILIGTLISTVEPIESGHADYELIGMASGGQHGVFYVPVISRYTTASWGLGGGIVRMWSDKTMAQADCYMADYAAAGAAAAMCRPYIGGSSIWREPNARMGKMEVMYGTPVYAETNNNSYNPEYSIMGILGGHWTTKGSIPRIQPLSTDGIKWDRLHLGNGIVIEWPEQFTPREIVPFSHSW